jgi:hypothetical protein
LRTLRHVQRFTPDSRVYGLLCCRSRSRERERSRSRDRDRRRRCAATAEHRYTSNRSVSAGQHSRGMFAAAWLVVQLLLLMLHLDV